ncbi:NAD-dependent protein deacetylase sirtuin-7-like [Dendronephthya gigantea]|uniref:NAD-dependent protein deacetylase sirtuin-7-like n=1 Tax=Dendronephthya gigantea TaxID=151771 RepID=UPI00106ADE78|nr:NAD-dependent protein deacetylase sirtuin-7-like [Dendronephthya gigantea]XP_028417312.1 NAD-dependent protein deacetylase sirtuin-7-like [Dendronephthya gigantea]XP_028418635.1 NAD-dependent protein deacetylase sirtuin-7-like [Dendronephthya gigantea]
MATSREGLTRKCTVKRGSSLVNDELQARLKQIKSILQKGTDECSQEELNILRESPEMVQEIERRAIKQANAKARKIEVCDSPEELVAKATQLANAIKEANFVVVYTGAGVSTAASIPDYRGPNGIWTKLSKGESIKNCTNLSDAEPTLTHMSILKLYQERHVKHVVSQNCDGLHLRSGLPSEALSEVHGNMYIEVCTECEPERAYVRTFDVTEKTALRRHNTGRMCHICGGKLRDTIVHFGEKGCLEWPLNWQGAIDAGKATDCIVCLGSSLKVLKRYNSLWGMTRTKARRPQLYIVNLQWTPKDTSATLKINGRCDDIMQLVMAKLGLDIPGYKRKHDPLFRLSTPLREHELCTKTTKNFEVLLESRANEHLNGETNPCSIQDVKHLEQDAVEWDNREHLGAGWYGKGYAKLKKPRKRRKLK